MPAKKKLEYRSPEPHGDFMLRGLTEDQFQIMDKIKNDKKISVNGQILVAVDEYIERQLQKQQKQA